MFTLTKAEQLTRNLGSADARVRRNFDSAVFQNFEANGWGSDTGTPKGPYTEAELLATLPAGSRVLRDVSEPGAGAETAAGTGLVRATALDLGRPDPGRQGGGGRGNGAHATGRDRPDGAGGRTDRCRHSRKR